MHRRVAGSGRSRTDRLPAGAGTPSVITMSGLRAGFAVVVTAGALALVGGGSTAFAAGEAPGAPGGGSSWATGNKTAMGTATASAAKVWFTAAAGVTTGVFYPRADVPDVQDMEYIVGDGGTFVDLERDATSHAVSMPDENALEYTITNTAKSGRYRLTNTYVTDPARSTLLIRTRFQSLDGGAYRLYVLYNPSLAGGAGGDTGAWDAGNGALVASDTQTLFGAPLSVASALKASVGFLAHSTGYSGTSSDGYQDIAADRVLSNQYDTASSGGNIVQTAQLPIGTDTTFTLALGFAADRNGAAATANASLASGFTTVESGYRSRWNSYLAGLSAAPASVSSDALRRRTYKVAVMALHAGEDKTFPGANVASLATPWGDAVDGGALSDGYHRVW